MNAIIFNVLVISVALAAVVWVVTSLFMNDLCFTRLEHKHVENVLKNKGLRLGVAPHGGDPAPCEIEWQLTGYDISITRRSWAMWRLYRKIRDGKLNKGQLAMMSDNPYSEIAR